MDLSKLLRIGERIDLRVEKIHYRSLVQDIPSPDNLVALHPVDRRNVPIHLEPDQVIEAVYFRANGQFVVDCRLLGRARQENIAVVRLLALGEPVRYQRRGGFRLPYRAPVLLHPFNPSIPLLEEYHSRTVDISESGVQVKFPSMVGLGTIFHVQFTVETDEEPHTIELRAAVSRMMPPEESGGDWQLGMYFLDCPEEMRRIIARFILLEQVSRRQDAADR